MAAFPLAMFNALGDQVAGRRGRLCFPTRRDAPSYTRFERFNKGGRHETC